MPFQPINSAVFSQPLKSASGRRIVTPLMFHGIDLFSDTVTLPSEAMKKAMFEAPLGDEQRGEDPTTHRLEERMAAELGKETALFFPSATMANEVALCALSEPGDEMIAAANCHLLGAESGGPAVHARLLVRPIDTPTGIFGAADIFNAYRHQKNPLTPRSRIVAVENTTNFGGGVAWPSEKLQEVLEACQKLGLSSHLDGARIFNAAVATDVAASEIAAGFDTVTVCLSKGLGCPTGAVLAFDRKLWPKVRRLKQLMGGSLRQSGLLAAAGLYALENNVDRLAEDHARAKRLAKGLSAIDGIEVENPEPSTNMVFFRWSSPNLPISDWLAKCEQKGLRFSSIEPNRLRAVTHLNLKDEDIERAIAIAQEVSSRE